jgi:DivIVA domain-containing protein
MWFFGLIVVLLIGAVAVVASGRWGAMSPAYDDRPDLTVPIHEPLTSADLESVRFGVGVRGYRMDEVDTLLTRVAREIAHRDRRIADLERAVAPIVEAPDGAGFTSRGAYDAGDFEDTGTQQPIMVGGDFPPPAAAKPVEKPAEEPAEEAAAVQPEFGDEPDTSELPAAVAADEYERLQAEARAVLQSQAQPGTRRRPAGPKADAPSTGTGTGSGTGSGTGAPAEERADPQVAEQEGEGAVPRPK